MPKRLAIYNFNNFRHPSDHPTNAGFHDRNDLNFAAAEVSDGFIARSGYDGDPGPASWGDQVFPRFFRGHGDEGAPSTLSLWEDLPSLFAFSYAGIHTDALRHARQWFDRQTWPPYVLWWADPDRVPTWAEGVERLEHMHDHGVSPYAFDFKTPFDEAGCPTVVDRESVKRKQGRNAVRQAGLASVDVATDAGRG